MKFASVQLYLQIIFLERCEHFVKIIEKFCQASSENNYVIYVPIYLCIYVSVY